MISRVGVVTVVSALLVAAALGQDAKSPFLRRFDRNRDGAVTKDELPPSRRGRFEAMDADGDGRITATEASAFRRRRGHLALARLP